MGEKDNVATFRYAPSRFSVKTFMTATMSSLHAPTTALPGQVSWHAPSVWPLNVLSKSLL